jgi:hypothetical protein
MLCLTAFLLLALPSGGDPKAHPKEIYRVWMHSREEDTDKEQVYRPKGTKLPPARGRTGFEVKERGIFVAHEIAPTDGTTRIEGRWEWKESVLLVTFPRAPKVPKRSLRILSCDKDVLRISKGKKP